MNRPRQGACILASMVFVAGGLLSAQAPKLELKTVVTKEAKAKKPSGETRTAQLPADQTVPGDVLTYTVSYQNAGKAAAQDASIVDPVPAGTVYRLGSARGENAQVTCSIDGGRSWYPEPVMMLTRLPGGGEAMVPAPADRYTHLRWVATKPLPPGATGRAAFSVTVQ